MPDIQILLYPIARNISGVETYSLLNNISLLRIISEFVSMY